MSRLRPRWLTAVLALGALGIAIVALQAGAGSQRAGAVATIPSGRCGPISTAGSTNTAGGGGLVIGQDLTELAKDSERVVLGTVKSFETCVDHKAGGVSTAVTIEVARDLKPAVAGGTASEVTVVVPGGAFGQLVLRVSTSAEFTAGEQVVAFLRRGDDGRLGLTGEFQGKFSVEPGGGVAGAGVGLASFERKVRQAVAGTLPLSEDPLGSAAGYGEAAFATSGPKWFAQDIPVRYYLNPNEGMPPQLTAANVQTAWTNAFNTWQNDPGSDISFSFQGTTTRDSGADQCGPSMPDGNNDLTWGIVSAPHSASTLAITFTCFGQGGQMLDADIEFDADAAHFLNKWRTDGTGSCGSGVVDLESVALHEIGHFIGLSHPSSNSCVFGTNGGCPVMNASYEGVQHNLCQDERDGVAAIYPAANPPTPSPTTTAGPSPTSSFTPGPTATHTATVPPTATRTPTLTGTPTATRTPTNTPTPSLTPGPLTDTPTPCSAVGHTNERAAAGNSHANEHAACGDGNERAAGRNRHVGEPANQYADRHAYANEHMDADEHAAAVIDTGGGHHAGETSRPIRRLARRRTIRPRERRRPLCRR